ncbi:MAG: hypothetical protein EOO47_03630 [Flavobacterium sp.]|nr:MAG: hypothetical protein EOO47_03630 [Flavobacterium sp.]
MINHVLFDKKIRTETRPAFGNENSFDYFNNTGRNDVDPIREVMENWYSIYPDSEKFEIRQRLKSDFQPAFYELGMHAYFKNQVFDLTIHPKLPNTTKHPDFLVKKDSDDFYVEIKEMRMFSDAERLLAKQKNTLLDSLNSIDSTNFLLSIQKIIFKNGSQPSGKKIIIHFDKVISTIEPDSFRIIMENGGYGSMPHLNYEDESVYIDLKLIPKATHLRGNTGRAIGSYGAYSKIGGDEAGIRDALLQKAKHYGELDKPFLICLNYPSSFLDENDVKVALFGLNNQIYGNGFEGFFGTEENPKNKRVSAVLITGFTVSGLANGKMYYHKNPFAKRPTTFLPSFDLITSLGLSDSYVERFGI